MELAPADVPLSFEVTFDSPSLHVAMSVYNDTGANPVLAFGPVAMQNVVGNTYRAKFTGTLGQNYIIFKAVYTDGTFNTLSQDYSQGSESIVCQFNSLPPTSNSDGCEIVGLIDLQNAVVGIVEC